MDNENKWTKWPSAPGWYWFFGVWPLPGGGTAKRGGEPPKPEMRVARVDRFPTGLWASSGRGADVKVGEGTSPGQWLPLAPPAEPPVRRARKAAKVASPEPEPAPVKAPVPGDDF